LRRDEDGGNPPFSPLPSPRRLSAGKQPDRPAGGRAGLLAAKLRRDPALQSLWDKGWRVLKFRQLRHLAESEGMDREQWEKELSGDPPKAPEQMRMF
jgi:hypothetical protein